MNICSNVIIAVLHIEDVQCFIQSATGYELNDRGSIPGRDKRFFSSPQCPYRLCTAHPVSYPVGSGVSFPRIKRPGREADHSPPHRVEVKNGGGIPPLLHTSSWCNILHRDILLLFSYLPVNLSTWSHILTL
jgi:hypothetical protein